MNCFNEEILQKYADNECTAEESGKIETHIEECAECKTIVSRYKKRSESIKKQMSALVGTIPEIPELSTFIKPERVISLRKKFVYGMAAASILLIVAFFLGKSHSSRPEETIVYYKIDYEIDANKPLADQEMVLYISDENSLDVEDNVN